MSSGPFYNLGVTYQKNGPKHLVLLHGLQSNRRLFDELHKSPVFKRYSILSLDLVGFGESARPLEFSYEIEAQADQVMKAIDDHKISTFCMIGHSLGGMIGTLIAAKFPERVRALISLEGNLTKADSGYSQLFAHVSDARAAALFSELRQSLQKDSNANAKSRANWMLTTADYAFYRSVRSIVRLAESEQLLPLFESDLVPKLLLIGDSSAYASRPLNIQTVIIPSAGHFLLSDNPKAVFDAIAVFLGELDL